MGLHAEDEPELAPGSAHGDRVARRLAPRRQEAAKTRHRSYVGMTSNPSWRADLIVRASAPTGHTPLVECCDASPLSHALLGCCDLAKINGRETSGPA